MSEELTDFRFSLASLLNITRKITQEYRPEEIHILHEEHDRAVKEFIHTWGPK